MRSQRCILLTLCNQSDVETKPEDFRLQARAYRKIGKENLALADEERANERITSLKSMEENRVILGRL